MTPSEYLAAYHGIKPYCGCDLEEYGPGVRP